MLKLLLFVSVVALTTIDATHFLNKLHGLESAFAAKSSHRALDHLGVRRRRDAEEAKSSESSSSEEAEAVANLLKFVVAVGWESEKVDMLSGFLDEMSDTDTNLTVVGWQRVLDADGKVKEIRTIQFVIPPKPEDPNSPSNIVEDDDDDDDDEGLPQEQIEELKEVFRPLALLGCPASVTYEEFDKEGHNTQLIYLDEDELYAFADTFAIYNKTSVASSQEVSDFINSLKPAALGKPSVLKYDVDGKLLLDQSHIRPQILGSVLEHHEVPDNILREAPEIIARISQTYHKEEIPKQLGLHYNKAYPEYKWRVLVDPEHFYVTRDVYLSLSYDNFDFDVNSDVSYLVYGAKK